MGDGNASTESWHKSRWSLGNGECVEVTRRSDGSVGVRHSKRPDGPILIFGKGEWAAFISGVRDGAFDTV
ncbi:DUF397 domain-containing protein [Sphaerisporangium perillae]|uniref:DUF397 domain-containing protein n=1 Tax=Sphaerisporangium perillae TaxID=2935860 RepID=UPI00200E0F39|nr:DUF397 domain-containing protein [Sphaerisporangium perillae]